jgi:hypothetical protein
MEGQACASRVVTTMAPAMKVLMIVELLLLGRIYFVVLHIIFLVVGLS